MKNRTIAVFAVKNLLDLKSGPHIGKCDFKHRGLRRYEGHVRRHMQEQSKDEDGTEYTERVTVIYK